MPIRELSISFVLITEMRSLTANWRLLRISPLGCRQHSSVPLSFFKVVSEDVDERKIPILILHGLFGSKNNWRSISNKLAKQTNRVIYSVDLRNHGDSPHVDGAQSDIATMASDIGLLMKRTYLESACILGHRYLILPATNLH